MSQKELLDQIGAIGFAMHEAALFLDTHPDCPAALDYFMQRKEELGKLTNEYQKNYGPLTQAGIMGDTWSWVEPDWPWHEGNGALNMRKDMR